MVVAWQWVANAPRELCQIVGTTVVVTVAISELIAELQIDLTSNRFAICELSHQAGSLIWRADILITHQCRILPLRIQQLIVACQVLCELVAVVISILESTTESDVSSRIIQFPVNLQCCIGR